MLEQDLRVTMQVKAIRKNDDETLVKSIADLMAYAFKIPVGGPLSPLLFLVPPPICVCCSSFEHRSWECTAAILLENLSLIHI